MTTANTVNDRIDNITLDAARATAPAHVKIKPLALAPAGVYDIVCAETGEFLDVRRVGTPADLRTICALAGQLVIAVNQKTGENFA